ncbi:hypothetical protein C8R46DRAFT_1033943 [Mycena filopes]|nr:hypothetical protein C8R46DRAFT_1033943 [Mycena filopes]
MASTDDQDGAVYVYRPMDVPGMFSRGQGRRFGFCMQPMVFFGRIKSITVEGVDLHFKTYAVTLGSPPNPNETGSVLSDQHIRVLREIAQEDTATSGGETAVTWGTPSALNDQPTIVIIIRNASGRALGFEKLLLSVDDDMAFKVVLNRIDHTDRGIHHMSAPVHGLTVPSGT